MSSSASHPVTAWPSNVPELSTLLGIERYQTGRCSGSGLKKCTCENRVHKASCGAIDRLLAVIIQAGSLTESVLRHLPELAGLVLCRRAHQQQAGEKEESFRRILRTITQPSSNPAGSLHGETVPTSPVTNTPRTTRPAQQEPRAIPAVLPTTERPRRTDEPSPASSTQVVERARSQPPRDTTSTRQTPSRRDPPPASQHTFLPFGAPRSTLAINKTIKEKLLNPKLAHASREGYIYAFAFPTSHVITSLSPSPSREPTTVPYLKIGHSTNPENRLSRWAAQCGYTPRPRFAHPVPYAPTVERLVQLQLHNARRREVLCPVCGITHIEWFQVSLDEAEAAVARWRDWLRRKPYAAPGGRLTPYWAARLERVQLASEVAWEWFVSGLEMLTVRVLEVSEESAHDRPATPPAVYGPPVGDGSGEPLTVEDGAPVPGLATPRPQERTAEVAGAILRLSPADKRMLFEAVLALVERQPAGSGPGSALNTSPARPLIVATA